MPKPSDHPIKLQSFLDKHVSTSPFPTSVASAEALLVDLYNNIPNQFYSRPKQILSFPPDTNLLAAEILSRGQAVLKNSVIEKVVLKVI